MAGLAAVPHGIAEVIGVEFAKAFGKALSLGNAFFALHLVGGVRVMADGTGVRIGSVDVVTDEVEVGHGSGGIRRLVLSGDTTDDLAGKMGVGEVAAATGGVVMVEDLGLVDGARWWWLRRRS